MGKGRGMHAAAERKITWSVSKREQGGVQIIGGECWRIMGSYSCQKSGHRRERRRPAQQQGGRNDVPHLARHDARVVRLSGR